MTSNEKKAPPSILSKTALEELSKGTAGSSGIMHHFAPAVQKLAPYVAPPALKPAAPPPPRVPEIRFPMWCGIEGKPFLVIAKREGQKLVMLRNEPMPARSTAGTGTAPANLGAFQFDYKPWPGCYFCGTKKSRKGSGFWVCGNECGGKFHCMGDVRGMSRCACGLLEDRHFSEQDFFDVQGTATKPATGSTPAAAKATAATLPEILRLGRK